MSHSDPAPGYEIFPPPRVSDAVQSGASYAQIRHWLTARGRRCVEVLNEHFPVPKTLALVKLLLFLPSPETKSGVALNLMSFADSFCGEESIVSF